MCSNLITFSDLVVENDETFLLELDSLDAAVVVSVGMAVVTIKDNDSTLLGYNIPHVQVKCLSRKQTCLFTIKLL